MFTLTLPWSVVGFWNATIGFLLLTRARDPVAAVNPMAARIQGEEPIRARTAILMCVRNEDPNQVTRNLRPLLEGLAASGDSARFHLYLLSDSGDPEIVAAEEAGFRAFGERWLEIVPVAYAAARMTTVDIARTELAPRFRACEGTLPWYCIDYWSRELGLDIEALKRANTGRIAWLPGAEAFLSRMRAAGKRVVLPGALRMLLEVGKSLPADWQRPRTLPLTLATGSVRGNRQKDRAPRVRSSGGSRHR